MPDVCQPHAHLDGDIFRIFRQQQAQRRAAGPPRFVAPPVADHRERNQRDVRHRMRQFHDRPRHVVVRRHYNQRFEAALADPASRLRCIAARIDGGAVEIDATAQQQRLVVGQRARNVAHGIGRMHARNQQPLAVAAGQQVHRIRHPRRAAGQHHDPVGIARRLDLDAAQLREKRDKAHGRADEQDRHGADDGRAQPSARPRGRRPRRAVVVLQTHGVRRSSSP